MTDKPVGTSYQNHTLMERAMVHTSSNTTQNTSQSDTNTINASKVQPVFTICIGSTEAGLAVLLEARKKSETELVPNITLVLDTLPYPKLVERIAQEHRLEKSDIEKAIPEGNYFHLADRSGPDFDFEAQGNEEYKKMLLDKRFADLLPNDSSGASGLAMKGYFRSYQNGYSICDFFRRHYSVLTQIDADNLDLDDGVLVRVFGTSLGGTSTGSTQIITAMLKDSLEQLTSKVDVTVSMILATANPNADDHSLANTLAMIREFDAANSRHFSIKIMDGKTVERPMDRVAFYDGRMGGTALDIGACIEAQLEMHMCFLRPEMQGTFAARFTDLTGISPYSHRGQANLLCRETARSIYLRPRGVTKLQSCVLLHWSVKERRDAFESYLESKKLSTTDEQKAELVVKEVIERFGLNDLSPQMETGRTPTETTINGRLDQAAGRAATLDVVALKQGVPQLLGELGQAIAETRDSVWKDAALQLEHKGPENISSYVSEKLAGQPHISVAVLHKLMKFLRDEFDRLESMVEKSRKERENLTSVLDQQLNELASVPEKRGIIFGVKPDEVARDSAICVFSTARRVSMARIAQERGEILLDHRLEFLANLERHLSGFISAFREKFSDWLNGLQIYEATYSRRISAQVGQFAMMLREDYQAPENIVDAAMQQRHALPALNMVNDLLAGKIDIASALQEMKAFTPSFVENTDTGNDIVAALTSDPEKMDRLIKMGMATMPTALNQTVLDRVIRHGARNSMRIIQLPQGVDCPLVPELQRRGVIPDPRHVVKGPDNVIRFLEFEGGLPCVALRIADRLRSAYQAYMANGEALNPHTQTFWAQLPPFEPPATTLTYDATRALVLGAVLLPDQIARHKTNTGFDLQYDEVEKGVRLSKNHSTQSLQEMVSFLAQRPETLQFLEDSISTAIEANFDTSVSSLRTAYQALSDDHEDKRYLRDQLLSLNLNPDESVAAE